MDVFFTEDEICVWTPFVISVLHLLSVLDTELKDAFDLSHLDYGILMLLNQAPKRLRRMSDLAIAFGVDPSNITYRVRRMQSRGLVERYTGSADGREVYAHLTDAGLALISKAQVVHVQGVRRHFLNHVEPDQLEVIADVFSRLRAIQQTPLIDSSEEDTRTHHE